MNRSRQPANCLQLQSVQPSIRSSNEPGWNGSSAACSSRKRIVARTPITMNALPTGPERARLVSLCGRFRVPLRIGVFREAIEQHLARFRMKQRAGFEAENVQQFRQPGRRAFGWPRVSTGSHSLQFFDEVPVLSSAEYRAD